MDQPALAAAFVELLDFLPDAVIVCDRSGTIRYANRRTAALLGFDPQALIGRPLSVLMPDRFRLRHAASAACSGLDAWRLRSDSPRP